MHFCHKIIKDNFWQQNISIHHFGCKNVETGNSTRPILWNLCVRRSSHNLQCSHTKELYLTSDWEILLPRPLSVSFLFQEKLARLTVAKEWILTHIWNDSVSDYIFVWFEISGRRPCWRSFRVVELQKYRSQIPAKIYLLQLLI